MVNPMKAMWKSLFSLCKARLKITVDETKHMVKTNQFIRFTANRPHQYCSSGKKAVLATMMICYLG